MAWLDLFPVLIDLPNFQLSSDVHDSLIWKDAQGIEKPFCSTVVWDSILFKQEEVTWHKSVWFPQMIPDKMMWLIMRRKLRTQDKMMQWCSGANMNFNLVCCSLCTQGPDSHNHLFFDCNFSKHVWSQVRHLAQIHQVSSKWEDILDWITTRANSKSAKSVIGKLLVATTYFIWQERNRRLFSNEVRKVDQIRDIVATSVRLKLVTLRFKYSNQVGRFVEAWNLPKGLVIYNP
uniref:uncharacterized protein LOC122610333 n=1 Tax=Erigeron canadensis TaxID=72917 RepID=UPI001CB97038|nr:uncharacterized protein LOC122610333 [Erigeron canadensis]